VLKFNMCAVYVVRGISAATRAAGL